MKIFLSLLLFCALSTSALASGGFSLGGNTLGLACSNGQVPEWNAGGFTQCLSASGSGTVTTVNTDSTTSSMFTNTANVIGTGIVTLTYLTQVKNKVLIGPSSGSDAAPTYRLLVGADLPLPGAASLGGVFSKAAVSHQFLTAIVAADGSVTSAQPAFTDVSGSVAAGQMPALTGDVTTSAGAVATTVAKIQGTAVTGTTGTGNILFQTGFVEEWPVNAVGATLTNATIYVVPYSTVGRKVINVRIACATSGTVTADLKIGGTNITTCNAISVTSTPQTVTCDTGSTSTLAATGILTLVTTSNSTCTDFYADVQTARQ